MVLGIQNLVRYAHLSEKGTDELRLLDGDRTYQNRLACLMDTLDFLAYCLVFELLVEEHQIVQILTDDRQVSGDDHDIQVVDLVELGSLGICRSGHTGDLLIHSEEVLERDSGKGLVLAENPDVFLGFDGLMQAVRIAAAMKDTSGKFINYLDLVVCDDVVGILMIEMLGNHCLGYVMDIFEVLVVVERPLDYALALEKFLHVEHTLCGEAHALGFLIQHVIALGLKLGTFLEAGECADNRIFACLGVFLTFPEERCYSLCVAGLVGIVIGLA